MMDKETKLHGETKSTVVDASTTISQNISTVASPTPPANAEPKPVDKNGDIEDQKNKASVDRDIALAHVEEEKRLSFIKAWEESEKTKALNKAQKKLSALDAWENTKKASIESKLKEIEEELEKKKAEYAERMKNMVAMIHKQAEEKRAMVQAKKSEDILVVDEKAAKYRATGIAPKKILGCISF